MKNILIFFNTFRNLKILSHVLLVSTVFYSCDNENPEKTNAPNFWAPEITIRKGDKEATLLLSDPRPYTEYEPGKIPSDPEYFNILISDNLKDFHVYKKVEASTRSVLIDNLVNEKSYYFSVTAHKSANDPVSSNIIMTIPSAEQKQDAYLPDFNFSIERLSTSHDMNYFSFNSNDYNGGSGSKLYFKNNTSGEITLLGADAENASWSGTMNRLVYMTTKQEGITLYPFALKVFDPESKISTTLFEIPYSKYYVYNPAFTPNGEKITFLSSENNSQKYIYDLWVINPVNNEKNRITNFEDIGFHMDGSYSFSQSGEELYLDGRHDLIKHKIAIYKLNTSTKVFTPVIESGWNDRIPKLSPDNTKLAFVSNRTGKDELWLYNLVTLEYKQVTGATPYHFDSRYTNLLWIDNDQMLITVFENTKSIAVKISVN